MEGRQKKFVLMKDSLARNETLLYLGRHIEFDFYIMIIEYFGNKLLYAGVGTELKLLDLADLCGRLRNMELYDVTPYFLKIDRNSPQTAQIQNKGFKELNKKIITKKKPRQLILGFIFYNFIETLFSFSCSTTRILSRYFNQLLNAFAN